MWMLSSRRRYLQGVRIRPRLGGCLPSTVRHRKTRSAARLFIAMSLGLGVIGVTGSTAGASGRDILKSSANGYNYKVVLQLNFTYSTIVSVHPVSSTCVSGLKDLDKEALGFRSQDFTLDVVIEDRGSCNFTASTATWDFAVKYDGKTKNGQVNLQQLVTKTFATTASCDTGVSCLGGISTPAADQVEVTLFDPECAGKLNSKNCSDH
jgi:hypothetical protein